MRRGIRRSPAARPFGVGVTSGLRPVPPWKAAADFTFVQVSFSVDALLRWRESASLQVPVYAGVMVLASAGMARKLASAIPDIDIPGQLIDDVERDRGAGVDAACSRSWPSATAEPSTVCIWCRSAVIGRSQHVWNVTSRHRAAGPRADLLPGPVPARGRGG